MTSCDEFEDEVRSMLDKQKIREVVARWCSGMDRCDAAMVNETYWAEATDNHGPWSGRGVDFAAFAIPNIRERFDSTMHILGQSTIILAGNRAAGETYCVAYHARKNTDVEFEVAQGRYIDRFEKRGREWRILNRISIVENFFLERASTDVGMPADKWVRGRRDSSDPFYSAMNELSAGTR